MPSEEGVWVDDRQSLSPCKQSGKQHRGQLASSLRPTRLDLALQVLSQLLAKEKILSGQSRPRMQAEPDEPHGTQQ